MTAGVRDVSGEAAARLLAELAALLGDDRVLPAAAAGHRFGPDTGAAPRRIAGAAAPRSTADVAAVVERANRWRVPLYPVSKGHNWGYGSAQPVTDDCVILDLSGMDRVLACDPELGVVTVQPGVTQRALKRYLDANSLEYLVPVHGGGPDCSIVGNALERGYGITPIADHFSAVTALTAVLPDGQVYEGALHEMGAALADKVFKWGVGPYLDGLFTQSNLGIVTEMTVALARKPACIEAFYFWVADDAQLEESVVRVRTLLQRFAGVAGSINLMNDRRVLAMMPVAPPPVLPAGTILSDAQVRHLCRPHAITPWTGVGALYGDPGVVRAAKAGIQRLLRPVARRLLFLSPARAGRLRWLLGWLPRRWSAVLLNGLDMAIEAQAVFEGVPTEVALRLACWKSGITPPVRSLGPARDGCGLLWFSPLVPMRAPLVRPNVQVVRDVCAEHGVEPLITLTSLSERCFDSTVPLLFDRHDTGQTRRARDCHRRLLAAARAIGCSPYRFGIDQMSHAIDPNTPFWRLTAVLKNALDPNHILAPGRYAPVACGERGASVP